ncbi:MAG: biliverdin-producing heme oxygenase [Xanthobacteraceae bacterium]|nr:biliverdin-producing heme oxygenase [Xanthobacteraceae bacterium]
MSLLIQDAIREATHDSHRRLDLTLSWLDLAQERYYAGFLRSQADALFPLERALEARDISGILADWPQRARSAALEQDLILMNVSSAPLPVPRFNGAAQMLGATYVLEASRMGARVMLARLAQHPESSSIDATKYLKHGFGKRFWPTFLAVLESHPAAQADIVGVVQGAELAFGMFESALVPVVSAAAE